MQLGKKLATGFLPTLLCLLAMLLAACGGGGGNGNGGTGAKADASKQIYVKPLPGFDDIKTFDPARTSDLYSTQNINMVFTGLVTLDNNGKVQDELAASHSVAADGTTYTFKLKPDLKFSDGTPLTSQDVVYSLDRALQPATKSSTASIYLGLIKDSDKLGAGKIKTIINDSLLAPDPQTVIIKTSQKAAYFLQSLTPSTSFVVEKSMIDKYGRNFADHLSEGIGGDGPFKVFKYTRGKEIQYVPNPNYFGPKPQLKKVVVVFIKQADTAYKEYQDGQLDRATVPAAQTAQAKALPNNQYHLTPILANGYIAMNYLTKPFDNIKIRQAFALAINKDEIAHNVYKDTVIASNHIVPQGMPGYNPNLTGPDGTQSTKGDATKAKELLQEGMKEEGITSLPAITLTTSSGGSVAARNQDQALQQMWQNALGVNVKINDEDFNKLLDDTTNATNNAKGIQMWEIGWIADYPDPQDWMTLQFDNGSQQNNMNYGQNKTSDAAQQQKTQKLMEQADQNLDDASRMQQYNQAEQQLVNDVAWLTVYQQATSTVTKPCLAGWTDNAQDVPPPEAWANVYKTTDTPCGNVSQYQS